MTITLGAGWRLYTHTVPPGSVALGVVSRHAADKGALILTAAGIYAQLNAGALRSLDRRQVLKALGVA